MPRSYSILIGSCGLYLLMLLLGITLGGGMIGDSDPLWHIATGDWIRAHGALPQTDPFSFTAGDYRWLNIASLWDILFSYVLEHWGWNGAVTVNAAVMALTSALIYANCVMRSRDGLASALIVFFALTMLPPHLRPLQVSMMMTALWLLVLGSVATNRARAVWLSLLPVSMALWVNMHGGFIIGLALLGAYFLYFLWQRDRERALPLLLTGSASFLAMFINPYGVEIIEAVRRPMTTVANTIITEWLPVELTPGALVGYLYAVLFVIFVPRRSLPAILPVERWLAYILLLMGLTSRRYLMVFAIIAAPILACWLQEWLNRYKRTPNPKAAAIEQFFIRACQRRSLAFSCVAVISLLTLWLPDSPLPGGLVQKPVAPPTLAPEIAFLRQHYPKARLMNDFDLGGLLLYEGRGDIAYFIDQRTETAFPPRVMQDYVDFHRAAPGWEAVLDRYAVDGVLLPNHAHEMLARFTHREGWRIAFAGPTATLFLRRTLR